MKTLRELYQYRQMLLGLIYRELKGKYKGSVLGFFWSMLIPLFQLLIYTLVFSVFMQSPIKRYEIFLFVALVPWLFFHSCITSGALSIVHQKGLIEKVYFPRIILPISNALSYFVNLLLSFLVVFLALWISGIGIKPSVLPYFPVLLGILLLMGLGVTLLFSALTVYFRDWEYILNIVTMGWMYMTPVLYPLEGLPDQIEPWLYCNPMTPVINGFRCVLYEQQAPAGQDLLYGFLWSLVFFILGWVCFKALEKNFVEAL